MADSSSCSDPKQRASSFVSVTRHASASPQPSRRSMTLPSKRAIPSRSAVPPAGVAVTAARAATSTHDMAVDLIPDLLLGSFPYLCPDKDMRRAFVRDMAPDLDTH